MQTQVRHCSAPVSLAGLWTFVGLLFLCLPAKAREPSIEAVSSPVCQRGSEVDLKIEGEGFEGCRDIVFYSPKIRCTRFSVESDYQLTAHIEVDEDCDITNQPYRVLSRMGYSDLRTLRVTPFPVSIEDIDGPTQIVDTEGRTFCGVLESGDIDRYQIELEEGDRLSVEVEAVRLGYELLDTVLRIFDPDGELLLQVDDDPLFQQDPVGSILAAKSGKFTIEVNETNYQGSFNSHYALHVGSFPRPGVAFPAGGTYEQKLQLKILSDDGNHHRQWVQLPGKETAEHFLLLPEVGTGGMVPTPIPFRLSELNAVVEQEPNDSAKDVSSVADGPIALDGVIDSPGDVDFFRVRFKAGLSDTQSYCIEAFADQIGSPIDTLLEIFDSNGSLVAANDDWSSHDSRIEFAPASDKEYFLAVSDKLGGGAKNGVYRVEIRPVERSLTAFLPRPNRVTQDAQVISVPQGNRIVKRVAVKREYVDGEVVLQFQGLPSGVFASPLVVPEDQFWVPAVLRADTAAELGGELAQLTATCTGSDSVVRGNFEQTVDLVHSTADQLFKSVTVDRLPVAVTPAVPFTVNLSPPKTGLPAGGQLQLRVELERETGFREPVRVTLPFLPPWVVSEAHIVIPANEESGVFTLEARPEASSRNWTLVAEAEVDLLSAEGDVAELESRPVASEPVELQIVNNPVRGEFEILAGLRGDEIRAICKLSPTQDFKGEFMATLEGLPARVTSEPIQLTSSEEFVEFKIEIAEDAPLGTFDRLQCRLSGTSNGQQVSYVVAKQTQLIVMEDGKLKRDADGRLLSPLEALRQGK